jgi:hypothetical protein
LRGATGAARNKSFVAVRSETAQRKQRSLHFQFSILHLLTGEEVSLSKNGGWKIENGDCVVVALCRAIIVTHVSGQKT